MGFFEKHCRRAIGFFFILTLLLILHGCGSREQNSRQDATTREKSLALLDTLRTEVKLIDRRLGFINKHLGELSWQTSSEQRKKILLDSLLLETNRINGRLAFVNQRLASLPAQIVSDTITPVNPESSNMGVFSVVVSILIGLGLAFIILKRLPELIGNMVALKQGSSLLTETDSLLYEIKTEVSRLGKTMDEIAAANSTKSTAAKKSKEPVDRGDLILNAQEELAGVTTNLTQIIRRLDTNSQETAIAVENVERLYKNLLTLLKEWKQTLDEFHSKNLKPQRDFSSPPERSTSISPPTAVASQTQSQEPRFLFDEAHVEEHEFKEWEKPWKGLYDLTKLDKTQKWLQDLKDDVLQVGRFVDRHRETLARIATEVYYEKIEDDQALHLIQDLLFKLGLELNIPRLGAIADYDVKQIQFREVRESRVRGILEKNVKNLSARKIDFRQSGTIIGVLCPEIRQQDNGKVIVPAKVVVY
ncbi:MAG: hypothetical protein ILNGONEN_01265 [Syntrophorhabdaceae bacterium]|nr:hypothetical protein [Syntrophorhabdaceae bacterium]